MKVVVLFPYYLTAIISKSNRINYFIGIHFSEFKLQSLVNGINHKLVSKYYMEDSESK